MGISNLALALHVLNARHGFTYWRCDTDCSTYGLGWTQERSRRENISRQLFQVAHIGLDWH